MNKDERLKIIEKSSKQVGPGVFYSTIVVITSFLPVFLLTGMEGKLFHPLAWTKTFILIIDAFLAITLAPVLISFFLKGANLYTHNILVPSLEKSSSDYKPDSTYHWRCYDVSNGFGVHASIRRGLYSFYASYFT